MIFPYSFAFPASVNKISVNSNFQSLPFCSAASQLLGAGEKIARSDGGLQICLWLFAGLGRGPLGPLGIEAGVASVERTQPNYRTVCHLLWEMKEWREGGREAGDHTAEKRA